MRLSDQRLTRVVAAFVFLSGFASLALEVCWSRSLELIFGSTTLAVTTILVAYMLGLGAGGWLGARLAGRAANGLRAYGWMEVVIGAYAACVPFALRLYPSLHRGVLAELEFWPSAFARFGLVLVVLLLPTVLMGATLPVLIEGLARERAQLGDRVGLLYGTNTLGAVAGVLLVTFLGLRHLGLAGTNFGAAGLDVLVGLAMLRLARGQDRPRAAAPAAASSAGRRWDPLLLSYLAVGFTALAYEVSWTRGLALVIGSSTYAFATMLAGFLAGIALGSLLLGRRVFRLRDPLRAYVIGLFLLGLAALGVGFAFQALPDLFLRSFATLGISGATLVWLGLAFSFLVMLAPTLVLGALFPLVCRLIAERGRSNAAAVGDVYFANALGSALGAFVTGFVLIPHLGLRITMAGTIAADFAVAALVLAWARRGARPLAVSALGLAAAVAVMAFPPSWRTDEGALGVYYRSSTRFDFGLPKIPLLGEQSGDVLFYREGLNCTVSVHKTEGGLEEGGISLRINGKTDASLSDMSTQILSGHLPILFGSKPRDLLVIGYASGITLGAATLHGLRSYDVCEIEPAVIEASHWFDEQNHRPLERDDVHLILDDGRSWLAAGHRQYDVIVSEPSNPWMTGCANLFTAEFFREANRSLRPGGRLLQWIQLYGMDREGLVSILAALHESFGYAYGFLFDTGSTDLLILATNTPLEPGDLPLWEDLSPAVRRDLSRVRIYSTADLWSLLRLTPQRLAELAAGATHTNTDDGMFVELRAPWYLYDDTPDTLKLLQQNSGGLLSFYDRPGFAWPDGMPGELALAYLDRRGDPLVGDELYQLLVREGDDAMAAVYEGERKLLGDQGDFDEILARFDESCEKAPQAFAGAYHRGWFLNQAGRYEEALADLDRALQVRPDHLEARHERMKSLASLQRMREAYGLAKELLDSPLAETEPRLWAETAFFAGGFGRFDEAIPQMRRYLELEPYSPQEWRMLARWYELTERPGEAARAEQNADLALANLVRRDHWLARWHERFGTKREALLALDEALEMDPDNASVKADIERLRGTP